VSRLWAIAGAVFAYLALAAVALAQDPTEGGYGGAGGAVEGPVEGAGGAGALPFTGLDVVLLIGAGALLLAAGVTLRRLGRAKG
jgi:hypothetical protein